MIEALLASMGVKPSDFIETLLASMGVKPSDFQEVFALAKTFDTRLEALEAGQKQILAAIYAPNQARVGQPSSHPNSPTCAVAGGKP